MTDTNSTSETTDEEPFMVLSAYDSELSFYAEVTATDPKTAVETAVKEKDDENLLPIKDSEWMEKGFIAVPKSEWHAFSHR